MSTTSVYATPNLQEEAEPRTIACIVDNEPGVLARVVGLFSARGYNIESLTVAETDVEKHRSRITIVTNGTPSILRQIEAQLLRLVPVQRVRTVTGHPGAIERELALFKVMGVADKRIEAMRLADVFRAKVIDSTHESFIFELTGNRQKIEAFKDLMLPLGLVELSRTGSLSIVRGLEEGIGDTRKSDGMTKSDSSKQLAEGDQSG